MELKQTESKEQQEQYKKVLQDLFQFDNRNPGVGRKRMNVIIGTRGSKLALAQAEYVKTDLSETLSTKQLRTENYIHKRRPGTEKSVRPDWG